MAKEGKYLSIREAPELWFVTSAKVANAVKRNRFRRHIREALRSVGITSIGIMVKAKPEAYKATYWEIREELINLLKKGK